MPDQPTDLMTAQRAAAEARVLVFVTFRYQWDRAQYLARLLRNLGDFCVRRMHVVVVTDTQDAAILSRLQAVGENYLGSGGFRLEVVPTPDPPTLLTWSHKPLLRQAALSDPTAFSHYVYLEDDLGFTFRNFLYFLQYVEPLRAYGLIPSFFRTEFNNDKCGLYSVDSGSQTIMDEDKAVHLADATFMSPRDPYCAMFVMDRAMIQEYLASRSFDLIRSEELSSSGWRFQERATMGLCFENPPRNLRHRYVLPVENGRILPVCQIDHMPANYTHSDSPHWGRLAIDNVFVRDQPGT